MQWTGLNDLRERFLSFFEKKGHTRMPSAPLIPKDDKSLLLINSGMAPLKKYFMGQATPPNTRVTTCQKCIRTPDIERVGKTSRHGTYFEMLGNFSFGDYFKHEATRWAWEFITEDLKLPIDKLWVSIYQDDDEAFDIWTKEVGVSPDRIVRLGKADNFWEHGTGPCGPCSEIYFDRGEEKGCGSETCAVGCDCDRFVEFWNLVFTQFDSDGKGTYTPLAKPNIDTGMGLERLACIMQGVDNLFEVDTVANIMKHVSDIAGVTYKEDAKTDVSLRVITDHIRSTTFMICDGVVPSNEGRGYVLRRLLRRAARHGRLLNINKPFLYQVADTVINENKSAYPELIEKADYIKKIIKIEEERFSKTIDQGMELLHGILDDIMADEINDQRILSGEVAFKLYDTFGFPIDLTREIIAEKSIGLDEDEFTRLMNEQREKARTARLSRGNVAWGGDNVEGLEKLSNVFVGYETLECEAEIIGIVKDNELVDMAEEGESVSIILNKTPFYGESGGQVGDFGVITCGESLFAVADCKKDNNGLIIHVGVVESGIIEKGNKVTAKVDAPLRAATARNHTAAHLLQSALITVLGDHVHQAGQLVNADRVRFDFSHFSGLTHEELTKVELIVNDAILKAIDVDVCEMPIAKAKEIGAMALFSEKYGDVVRVCKAGDVSTELCGGTHVKNTAQIGLFKILSESSVAAGVRRIEAVTGFGVLELLKSTENTIIKASENLKLQNTADLVARTESIMIDLKNKDKEIEELNAKLADLKIEGIFDNAIEVRGLRYMSISLTGTKMDVLRGIADKIRDKAPKSVSVIAGSNEGKMSIVVACGKDAVARGMNAGKIMKEITSLTGGSGGGRPELAMGGIADMFRLDEAMAQVPSIIEKYIITE